MEIKIIKNITNTAQTIWLDVDTYIKEKIGYISNANGFVIITEILRDLYELLKLNLKIAYQENNILTAQQATSIRSIAVETGHEPARAQSANGILTIALKSNIADICTSFVITQGAQFKSEYNTLIYTTKENYFVNAIQQDINISVTEGTKKTFIPTDFVPFTHLYTIRLNDTNTIDYRSVSIYVNGIKWKKYVSFADMGMQTEGYIQRNGFANQIDIFFGDGTQGKIPTATPTIEYYTTNGENGNIPDSEDIKSFSLVSGILDQSGNSLDINNDYAAMYVNYGFMLGSNGENIEKTRNLVGFNSRANVIAQPDNLIHYLSKFSNIGTIKTWYERNDFSVIKMLLTRNIIDTFNNNYLKYFDLTIDDIKLPQRQINALYDNIKNAEIALIGNEIESVEPELEQYAAHVFIHTKQNNTKITNSDFVNDKSILKQNVLNVIGKFFLEETLQNTIQQNGTLIVSKNKLENNVITQANGVDRCYIRFYNETNEQAIKNGYYTRSIETYTGGIYKTETQTITLIANENPNIGLTDTNDIINTSFYKIPILKPIRINTQNLDYIQIPAISVFIQENNNWIEI